MQIVLYDGGTRILGTYVSKGFTTVGSVYLLLGGFQMPLPICIDRETISQDGRYQFKRCTFTGKWRHYNHCVYVCEMLQIGEYTNRIEL